MNYQLRIVVPSLLAAVLAGCGPSRPDVDARADPKDKRVVALVAWMKDKGVTLEATEITEGYQAWRLTHPKASDAYDVVFYIRSFPPRASEEEMREALDVNLAYQLNAPAHLAMSYGGFHGTRPDAKLPKSDDELPKIDGLPITKAVERWFMEYKPDPL